MFFTFWKREENRRGGEALVVAKGRFPSPAPLPSGHAKRRMLWLCYVIDWTMDSAFVYGDRLCRFLADSAYILFSQTNIYNPHSLCSSTPNNYKKQPFSGLLSHPQTSNRGRSTHQTARTGRPASASAPPDEPSAWEVTVFRAAAEEG